MKELVQMMQQLIDTDLAGVSAKEFNQFVRAQLFVAADFLLTNWPAKKDPTDPNAEAIAGFCSVLIKLICKWLSLAPKSFALVIPRVAFVVRRGNPAAQTVPGLYKPRSADGAARTLGDAQAALRPEPALREHLRRTDSPCYIVS